MRSVRIGMLVLFMLVLAMVSMSGCYTQDGLLDKETGNVYTPDEAATLPTDVQARLEPVQIQQINPEIAGKITTGSESVQAVYAVVRPLVPEPYGVAIAGLLGLAGTLWELVKKKKAIKEKSDLATWANRVKLGAEITAKTVDTVVRPAGELWKAFKKSQAAAAENTDAIMPNDVNKSD